ncbi:hypothetical protein [Streptomyces sp. NPDC056672]|uniref:hypothetical protein n=1 Tax=Streptomyces sp. NPDC056672 TaxID=3345906 RepID=UPI0036AFD5B4
MTSVTGTPGSIEATTALLLSELPQLEAQQQALQNELAAVTERLGSVRTALTALQALSAAPHVPEPTVSPEAGAESGTEHGAPVGEKAEESAATAAEETTEDGTTEDGTTEDAAGTAGDDTAGASAEGDTEEDAEPTPASAKVPRARASRKAPAEAPKERKRRTAKKAVPAVEEQPTGGLTEQILTVLANSADAPVRARDVAQALGRDESPGSINAVRSTLDRLVGSSRAHRAGRGLYQAVQG